MKKSSKKLIVALLCAAAAVLVGLVAYDGIKQSREFSSSSAMMNTAVSADIGAVFAPGGAVQAKVFYPEYFEF